jgi:hypothetical protein
MARVLAGAEMLHGRVAGVDGLLLAAPPGPSEALSMS